MNRRHNISDELRKLLAEFENSGNAAPLLEMIEARPEIATSCSHDYPDLHRILDLRLSDRFFRLGRCILCDERLTLMPIEATVTRLDAPGVPLALTGEYLRRALDWTRMYEEKPDWAHFLAGGQGPRKVSKRRRTKQDKLIAYIFGKQT